MPPRASSDIRLETPSNGADPITAADFDINLLLRFEGGFYMQFRALLPFLPWADEVVAAGSEPTYSNISTFAIVDLLLNFVSFNTAALTRSPIDTTLKATFIRRVVKQLLTQNLTDEPVSTAEDYLSLVRAHVQGLEPASRAFLVVTESALQRLQPKDAPYPAELAWLTTLSWGNFTGAQENLTGARRFLNLLGDHATKESRESMVGRVTIIAAQVKAGFEKVFSDFTFPPSLLTQQIVSWFCSLKFPAVLDAQLDSVNTALTEFLRMYRYEVGTTAQQSLLTSEVFDRILRMCPTLQAIAGDAPAREAHDAMRPMLAVYEIPSAPLAEDWKTLNSSVTHLQHLVEDLGSGASLLTARVKILIDDKQHEKRVGGSKSNLTDASSKVASDVSIHGRVSSASLNELRRSPALLELVRDLNEELDAEAPSQSNILSLCLSSRLSGVVRYMTGMLDALEISDVFPRIAHLRARKLNQDSLARIAKHLWLKVFKDEVEEYPRVADATFHAAFVRDLFSAKWSSIDFEQRLLFDLDLAKSGSEFNGNYSRPKSQWFQDEHALTDAMVPISALFQELGYTGAQEANSFASILKEAREGFQHARRNVETAPSVLKRAKELIPKAVVEAQEAYSNFVGSSSALAPFPEHWLPLDSTATAKLESSKRAAKAYNDLMADLKEVMEDSPLKRAKPTPTPAPVAPSSSTSTKEKERLAKEVKLLKQKIEDLQQGHDLSPIMTQLA